MKARVGERGQVTIPKVLRKKLGIRSGTLLDFDIKGGILTAIKTSEKDNVDQIYGCLGKLNTDKLIIELRGKV